MRFARWLRAFLDELHHTPYVKGLEHLLIRERADWDSMSRHATNYHLEVAQQLSERLKDKDATIADLRIRLAVAETDAMREKLAKQTQQKVPDFSGPVAFQDEVSQMPLDNEEEAHDEV